MSRFKKHLFPWERVEPRDERNPLYIRKRFGLFQVDTTIRWQNNAWTYTTITHLGRITNSSTNDIGIVMELCDKQLLKEGYTLIKENEVERFQKLETLI